MQGTWPCSCSKADFLHALAADTAGQLHVLGKDPHALGVDGANARVVKEIAARYLYYLYR